MYWRELQLSPCFIEAHGHGVGQIQATGSLFHRNLTKVIRPFLMKVEWKPCGLRTKNQMVILPKVNCCVEFCRFRGKKVKGNL